MAGIARPFIPWIGSKEKLIPYIWQVFPPRPKLYLEPFGGGGALLLGMQPKISRMDIYNDFNCDLVNLFLCARECTVQLVQELKFLPLHSRAEFDLLKEFMKHKELLQQRIVDERNAVMECFSGEEREELLQILRGAKQPVRCPAGGGILQGLPRQFQRHDQLVRCQAEQPHEFSLPF